MRFSVGQKAVSAVSTPAASSSGSTDLSDEDMDSSSYVSTADAVSVFVIKRGEPVSAWLQQYFPRTRLT